MKHLTLILWLLFSGLVCWPVHANNIDNVRIWPSPDSTRVVLDMQQKPVFRLLPQQGQLLTLEIDQMSSARLGKLAGESDLLKSIRVQKVSGRNTVRVLLDLTGSVRGKAFYLAPMDRYGHRLVVDLTDVAAERAAHVSSPAGQRTAAPAGAGREIVIAIDAGHGGHDPGAIGPKGTYEKQVTMAVAERMIALINQQPGFKAVLTRTGDYYIHVNKRPDIARTKQADVLVSIHADAAENRSAAGASVWVLSLKRATTELGRMLEKSEQHSELLGGVAEVIKDSANERYLTQTVLDLSMNHSISTAFDVAGSVLRELGRVTKLHKKEPQSASFGVLKAPDIPSILVETGFISNHAEEQRLKTRSHQHKLAQAVSNALIQYFKKHPPADTQVALAKNRSQPQRATSLPASSLPASNTGRTAAASGGSRPVTAARLITHKVKAGESLSMLARQYGVPMSRLRELNKLKSDNILIGQTLKVPQP